MALESGTRLGPYAILSPIGAGGMGEVYKAKDTRLDRTVAVKVLRENFGDSPERKARFEREAKAISQLNHAHIFCRPIPARVQECPSRRMVVTRRSGPRAGVSSSIEAGPG